MIGSLTKCIAEFLRNTEVVKENNIPVYTANTVEGRFTVNTSLPAVLVTVAPSENPAVFISGNILDSIIIHIRYMDDLLNYTMSEDDGIYEERRNWAYLLRDELWNGKQSSYFRQFMNVNGLNVMYKGMSTYTQVGVLENLSKDIDVFSFIFSCNLFSGQLSNSPTVPLEEFFITLEGAHGETPEPTFQTVRASGEKFVIWNSVEASDKVKSLSIHGKSYQDGTPTPLAPVEIQSVGDNSLLLQIGDSKESVNHTIDVKKAIQDAGYDGVLRSIGVLRDDVNYNNETNKCILNKRLGISRGFIVNSFTGQETNGNLRFVRINGSVKQGSVNASIQNFYSNKFYYTGDSTSNKWNNVYGVYANSLRYGFYLVYDVNDYPTEDDLKKMIEDESSIYIYALQDEIEANIALENIPTYSNETWISTKKENVNPRIVMDCEVSEILDYIRDGLIGYYTGRGRSNTDENKNILPDRSGNGNDLENKNFAYTPDSGYGDGYIQYDGVDDFSNVAWTDVTTKSVLLVCEDIVNTKQSPYYSLTSMIGNDRSLFGGISNGKIPANNIYGYFNSSNLGSELYTKDFSLEKGILNIYLGNTGGLINNPEYVYNLCIGAGNFYANPPRYSCKVKIYDFLAYTRKLTDEEIEHNYKASLQYNGMTL
jgi:hypothetical protein